MEAKKIAETESKEKAVELQEEALASVTGGLNNPFEGDPRVPDNPIDPDLRQDG